MATTAPPPAAASAAALDPFAMLKDAIADSMKKLMSDVDKWKEVLYAGKSATNKDFPVLTKAIEGNVAKIETNLKQGLKISGAIKKNRAAFPHIDDRELRSREDFLQEMGVLCKDIKAQLTSPETKSKIEADKKKFDAQQREKKNSKYAGLEREAQRENDAFIDEQKDQVQMHHEQQDLVLEDMSVILKSIGVMAEEMQSEIADQSKMLEENNKKADDVNDKSQLVINRLQAMLNTNDKGRICAIGVLLVILIILCIIVFFF